MSVLLAKKSSDDFYSNECCFANNADINILTAKQGMKYQIRPVAYSEDNCSTTTATPSANSPTDRLETEIKLVLLPASFRERHPCRHQTNQKQRGH